MKLDFADYRVTIAIVSVDLRAGYVRLSAIASCLMNIDVDQRRISRRLSTARSTLRHARFTQAVIDLLLLSDQLRALRSQETSAGRGLPRKGRGDARHAPPRSRTANRTDLKCTAWTRRPCSARRFRKPPSRSHISSPSPRFSTHGLHGRHAHADGKTLRGTGRHRRHSHSSRSRKQPRPGRLRRVADEPALQWLRGLFAVHAHREDPKAKTGAFRAFRRRRFRPDRT